MPRRNQSGVSELHNRRFTPEIDPSAIPTRGAPDRELAGGIVLARHVL